ncbi:hypothetical protein [Sphingomonas sp. DT-51]|uniref:hypothetical protein n=1 Tax=Sphingomonas sp. DT-51 TaxID=3396165 RepID=UPI003F53F96B
MLRNPTIIVKLQSAHPKMTWGLFLPNENRWLALLFDRERDARRFAKDHMQASSTAWVSFST